MARAMINEPLIILADEPTGNLDSENARAVFKLFDQINLRGATILIATHQIHLAKEFGKKIIHLNAGELESGNHE
jgi:cell division transport system ATP-binding protein